MEGEDGSGGNASGGEGQMKRHVLARYQSAAGGLGTPTLNNEEHNLPPMIAFLISGLASCYGRFL